MIPQGETRKAPTVRDRAFHILGPNALQNHLDLKVGENLITPRDRDIINKYIDERRLADNIQEPRAFKIMSVLVNWRRFIGPFDENTTESIYAGITRRKATLHRGRPLRQNSTRDYITFLKRFYKWLIENGYSTIPLKKIQAIKPPSPDKMTKTVEELLTEEEVMAMIDACMNSRDRALISVLYEGAFRIIEVATLEWQQVKFDTYGAVINTNKKTEKARYIRLVSSVPLLATWRKDYPFESEGENLVFLTRHNKPLEHGQITLQLKKIARRAGIRKRVHPHLFRHSRVSHLLKAGCSESVVKAMCWGSQSTKMLECYAHFCQNDIDTAVLRLNGIEFNGKSEGSLMVATQCRNCETISEPGARYCGRCGLPLSEKEGRTMTQLIKRVEQHPIYLSLLEELKKQISSFEAVGSEF